MITRVRGGGEIELRSFGLTDMVRWGDGALRNIAPWATESNVRGLPAIHRAARIRAEAIAMLRLHVWRGEGASRQRVDTVWQARLFRGQPNDYCSRFQFWETVGESLAYRNNAYIWKNHDPATGRVFELYALHPDQVKCEGFGKYVVNVRSGYVDPVGRGIASYEVDGSTILHIRGHGQGGTHEAPTPIEVFREALEAPLARQRHETRMWRKGTSMQVAVVFPQGVSKEQADPWKEAWRAEYTGSDGETTPMVGGGADIKPIGMTQADAKYVEMANLSVYDAQRIMGVPASMLGAQMDTPPNLEQDLALWFRTGLGPELARIESSLEADFDLFGPRATVMPGFDTEGFVHADVMTEDNVAHQRVQDGRLLVDEWRSQKGLPPLPNGAGMVPQVVPVGGGANPNPGPTPASSTNGAQAE